jgi:ATP-dependent DNA helicase RecG
LIEQLPFKLTKAQKRVINEIINDFKKPYPMNRFLYGDVGSGKTVVAAIASYVSYLNHYQTLLMAPTEILAQQHFQTISKLLHRFNDFKISLLTATHKPKPEQLKQSHLVIGTHALIQKKVNFDKVGLVIIDEQHRFGVNQRAQLRQKGINPHLLTMTATPIPRSLFLTFYGELTLSYIDEMPKGRLPIKTYVVPKEKRDACYQWIKEKIDKEKIQVYLVCPLIEESDVETMISVKAAKKEFQYLKNKIFTSYKLGLLHGRMKAEEKDLVMRQFKDHKIDILVTTSVIEVGIDVPNANIIVIEGSERFGLAQLHQLRGRVGRSDKQSYCFLFTEKSDPAILSRLNFFAKNLNGMRLAEYDLQHRGPGEVFGLRQHGFINLKIASLTNFHLIEKVKNAVNYFLHNQFDKINHSLLKERLLSYQTDFVSRD